MKHFLYGFIATLIALIIIDPEPKNKAVTVERIKA